MHDLYEYTKIIICYDNYHVDNPKTKVKLPEIQYFGHDGRHSNRIQGNTITLGQPHSQMLSLWHVLWKS